MDNLIGALDFSGGSGMGGMNNSGSMMNSNTSSGSTGMMGLDFGSPSPAPAPAPQQAGICPFLAKYRLALVY